MSSARSTVDELMHAGKWAGGTGERKKSRTGKWLTVYKVVSSLYRAGPVSYTHLLCSKGDSVLLHSPTYIGFTNSLTNNGYHIVHSPLVKDENNVYRMDFEDMEKKIMENHIHAAIFCSPHNPTGRVWEQWEIEKAMEIYKKHDVYVVSDEKMCIRDRLYSM